MAEWTPNLRASYEAAETTPRSSRCPPTTTAFPFSEGSKSSSTETKKASISTWKIVRVKVGMWEATAMLLRIVAAGRRQVVRTNGGTIGLPHCVEVDGLF